MKSPTRRAKATDEKRSRCFVAEPQRRLRLQRPQQPLLPLRGGVGSKRGDDDGSGGDRRTGGDCACWRRPKRRTRKKIRSSPPERQMTTLLDREKLTLGARQRSSSSSRGFN